MFTHPICVYVMNKCMHGIAILLRFDLDMSNSFKLEKRWLLPYQEDRARLFTFVRMADW